MSDARLPPDRSWVSTEQRNPGSMSLHTLSIAGCVDLITEEDRRVHEAMARAKPALAALISDIVPRFLRGGRLIYVGAGTSGRLGVLDASEAPPTFQVEAGRIVGIIAGGDGALRKSSEGAEDDTNGARDTLVSLGLTENDSVIGLAAGGTTPYVLGAIRLAKHAAPGSLAALITCSEVPKPAGADHLIVLETGAEVLTGSTRMKAGTATKLALNTISTTVMIQSGKVYENLMVDLRASNDKLRDRAARIVSTLTGVDRQGAITLLDLARGSAKVAVVMGRLGVDSVAAEAMLSAAGGRLDVVLSEAPPIRSR
ncbi:MAG: N-acetylmuramic acid 6-phosphate etherase [Phycisphaeraceae bacterium]|nr:N-acetylmuramic acid 6-phosphate etherase [Phycisphaeraceae bacterium]